MSVTTPPEEKTSPPSDRSVVAKPESGNVGLAMANSWYSGILVLRSAQSEQKFGVENAGLLRKERQESGGGGGSGARMQLDGSAGEGKLARRTGSGRITADQAHVAEQGWSAVKAQPMWAACSVHRI
mmetsp:Transcript_23462/g.58940  ORF Transcript_23462/g.58940 Transcript_23462/m.58940 type:complete len:127 (-) Transcript_23462:53-433(-)